MSRILLIGDSNVYRNVTVDRFSSKVNNSSITIINATKQQTFDLGLKEFYKGEHDVLLVSALANLLSDSANTVSPVDIKSTVSATTLSYLKSIQGSTRSDQRVLLVPLFLRSSPTWFKDHIQSVNSQLSELTQIIPNICLLPEFKVKVTDLLSDGVHLQPEAGMRFFDYLVSCCLDVQTFEDNISRSQPTDSGRIINHLFDKNKEPTIADVLDVLTTSVIPRLDENTSTKSKIVELDARVSERFSNDDVMFARHSEELDNMKNDKWCDRVVVVGVSSAGYSGSLSDRKSFLSKKFQPLIESIVGEIVYDIYPRVSLDDRDVVPPFEIRFPSVKICSSFKKEAFKKVKEDKDKYGEISFHPKMTLASRVRVEILRAISRKIISPTLAGYCPIYNPRPILHVGPMVDGRVDKRETLTYVDAVLRFRHLLTINDLSFAYQRVSKGFPGCLRQTFIVLNDDDRRVVQGNQGNQPQPTSGPTRGQKRPGDMRGRGGFRGKRAK